MSSKLSDYKDSPAFAAIGACIESAEKNPKFAADHYRGALLTLGLRAKKNIIVVTEPLHAYHSKSLATSPEGENLWFDKCQMSTRLPMSRREQRIGLSVHTWRASIRLGPGRGGDAPPSP